jgi:5-methylcytosine-specific restriction protein A
MPTKRSAEMILAGYYLARAGRRLPDGGPPLPPAALRTDEWSRAYACFYGELGDGRTLRTFSNSLKNARDLFDGHVDSGRVGWRETGPGRAPLPLTRDAQRVVDRWGSRSISDLWEAVQRFADPTVGSDVPAAVLKDLEAILDPAGTGSIARSEGKQKMVVSVRRERDPRLRADAIRIHGARCSVCTFDFAEVYGDWGDGFIEVHHVVPLNEGDDQGRVTDPATDLIVLCANCHAMVHRRQGVVLTLAELRSRMSVVGARSWVARMGG